MLAEKNEFLQEAAQSVYVANADEIVRQQCLAREEAERYERTLKRDLKKAQEESKVKDAQIDDLKTANQDLQNENQDLQNENQDLQTENKDLQNQNKAKDAKIKELEKNKSSQDAELADLKKRLAKYEPETLADNC